MENLIVVFYVVANQPEGWILKVPLHDIKTFYLTNINLMWWVIIDLKYATLN